MKPGGGTTGYRTKPLRDILKTTTRLPIQAPFMTLLITPFLALFRASLNRPPLPDILPS